MKFNKLRILFLALLCQSLIWAQSPPGYEIYLVKFKNAQGDFSFDTPQNISKYAGYDNQPHFTPDSKSILFTSIRNSGFSDVYEYFIASQKLQQITHTDSISEFSPTIMPGKKTFSSVLVEKDNTQRLWQYSLDGKNPKTVLDNVKLIGYHAWAGEHHLGLFVLGKPHKLFLADTKTGKADSLTNNIGRSLHKIPGEHALSYTTTPAENQWDIMAYNLDSKETRKIVTMLSEVQDYTWTPNGTIIAAKGNTLYSYHPGKGNVWQKIHQFADTNINGIGRLAVSPDQKWLAFVIAEPKDE